MKSFEELACWKTARELRKEVSRITKTFPEDEKFRLVDQMLRCSRSVTANIAEGYGKFYIKDNVRYCRSGKGSLTELKDHFLVALDEGYINISEYKNKAEEIEHCIKILNGYINYLNKMNESKM